MEFTIPYRDILDFWFGDSGGLEGETDDTRGWPPQSLRRSLREAFFVLEDREGLGSPRRPTTGRSHL